MPTKSYKYHGVNYILQKYSKKKWKFLGDLRFFTIPVLFPEEKHEIVILLTYHYLQMQQFGIVQESRVILYRSVILASSNAMSVLKQLIVSFISNSIFIAVILVLPWQFRMNQQLKRHFIFLILSCIRLYRMSFIALFFHWRFKFLTNFLDSKRTEQLCKPNGWRKPGQVNVQCEKNGELTRYNHICGVLR